jgi:hypothetical protein
MKILSSFMAANVEGADRISYTYSEIDEESGKILGQPKKESFVVLDGELLGHITAIRDYVRRHKLQEEK